MIFPILKTERVVQVGDRTRLDASKSYVTPDEAAITLIEIEPEASAGFIDVTTNQYLDFQYSTDGTKVVTARVTTDGAPVIGSVSLTVVTEADDRLFSGDQDLVSYEPNILDWARAGRNSFLDVHRAAQNDILNWLDRNKIWDIEGNRLTKEDIVDLEEVADWSKFLTLRLVFEGISNAVDDVFAQKALRYKGMETEARNRAALRLDRNNDGTVDTSKVDLRSVGLYRR